MKKWIINVLILLIVLIPVVSSNSSNDTDISHEVTMRGTLWAFSTYRALSIGNNWYCLDGGYLLPAFDDDVGDVELMIDGEIQDIEGYSIIVYDFKGKAPSRLWLAFPLIRLLSGGSTGQPYIELHGTCSSIEYLT